MPSLKPTSLELLEDEDEDDDEDRDELDEVVTLLLEELELDEVLSACVLLLLDDDDCDDDEDEVTPACVLLEDED